MAGKGMAFAGSFFPLFLFYDLLMMAGGKKKKSSFHEKKKEKSAWRLTVVCAWSESEIVMTNFLEFSIEFL